MRANRGKDTGPELALRSALHRTGKRYRVHTRLTVGDLRVRPDVVFTRQRVAVFVDGCFWHACPQHGQLPVANRPYWTQKLEANVRRDRRAEAALTAAGWRVVRIWEHEPVDRAVELVLTALAPR